MRNQHVTLIALLAIILSAGCAYKPPSTTFKTETTRVPVETKKWVDESSTRQELAIVNLRINYTDIESPALEGEARLRDVATSYIENFYRERKTYHYVGKRCTDPKIGTTYHPGGKKMQISYCAGKLVDANKTTDKLSQDILSEKTDSTTLIKSSPMVTSRLRVVLRINNRNILTDTRVKTNSRGRFSIPLSSSVARALLRQKVLDIELAYGDFYNKKALSTVSFATAYSKYEKDLKLAEERERKRKLAERRERERRLAEGRERKQQLAEQRERERLEYERRISVAFSGGMPTFSSWQQTFPYAGASSGKALLDIKNRYEATATAYLQLADKQTQIPKVPQPQLPPQVAVEQGKYESDKTFGERVQAAIDERNDKIVQLQERYQQQVAERNARIDALNQLQRQRQAQLEDNKIDFIADAMKAELVDFKVRNASFDQATALLYFDLYSTNSDYQELIAIESHDPLITERLAENPEQIQPELTFHIEGNGFSLQQVTLKAGRISEVAQVMTAKNVSSRGQQRVVIDSSKLEAASGIAAVAGLQKQNPNIVDRFRTGVITYNNGKTEQRDTGLDNDELWLAVQDLRNSRLNDNAFLFVIGIEDYKSAAPVPYAENSALVTKELLRVKAGVPDKNVYLLTQDKTTGTQIRGELSNMLGRLDSDSLVYFYYAGHGVPDIGNNESVYLLPADAVQGAYQDDNFKLDNIMRQIAARQPQHAYFFLDTCFSGRVNRNELLFPGVGALMVETIKPKVPENVTVFYGGQGTQFANAFDDKRHRLMSYYLAKGVLEGKDGISELSNYVNRAVRKESLVKGGDFRQEPFIDGATEGRLFRTAAAR